MMLPKIRFVVMLALVSWLWLPLGAQEFANKDSLNSPKFRLFFSGYVKEMPSFTISNLTDEPGWDNLVHNRLNLGLQLNDQWSFSLEVRNRYVAGSSLKYNQDLMENMLDEDPGLLDLSWVPLSSKGHLVHINADRLFVDWRKNRWQLRLGRQRINWGINMVSNPNDLFNNYSFFDFDYEERPGSDALRVQYNIGGMSRLELAVSPADQIKESVGAMLYGFNTHRYDIQFIGGYFHHRAMLGWGWAGSLKSTGFKGEMSLFSHVSQPDSMNFVAAISFDHLFPNGIYGFLELMYNGGHDPSQNNLLQWTQPMRADNIFPSSYAVSSSLMYPVSPIFSATLASVYMPDINAFYAMPGGSLSVATNLDASLLLQYVLVGEDIGLQQFAAFLRLKYSF